MAGKYGHLRIEYSPIGDGDLQHLTEVTAVGPDGAEVPLATTSVKTDAPPNSPAVVELSTLRFKVVTPG